MKKAFMFAVLLTVTLLFVGCGAPGADTSSPEGAVESILGMEKYYKEFFGKRALTQKKLDLDSAKQHLQLWTKKTKESQEKRIKESEKEGAFYAENASKIFKFDYKIIKVVDTGDSNVKLVKVKLERTDVKRDRGDKVDDEVSYSTKDVTQYRLYKVKKEDDAWKIDAIGYGNYSTFSSESDMDKRADSLKESIK